MICTIVLCYDLLKIVDCFPLKMITIYLKVTKQQINSPEFEFPTKIDYDYDIISLITDHDLLGEQCYMWILNLVAIIM